LFACEQAGISPDFMCLSKGLTGGFLPLSAMLTREHIYQAFYAEHRELRAFLHSHSYTGNPLACAAALATLDVFEQQPVLERNAALAAHLARAVAPLAAHPHVADIRQRGMICAIELVQDKAQRTPYPWQERRGMQVYRHALTRGVLLRPIGDVIYFMPPYVIMTEEIDLMVDAARTGIDLATNG
jgi:adenosylmethionine-8-amino-7-oxononanoate aminotransferase